MQALIDGDILVYRSGFAAEHDKCAVFVPEGAVDPDCPLPQEGRLVGVFDGVATARSEMRAKGIKDYWIEKERVVEPLANSLYSVKNTIKQILAALKTKDYRVFLSEGENFRHELATLAKYKGNRDDMARPVHYHDIRQYLVDVHHAEVYSEIEADDALADNQTKDTCICSIDKDLLQIPGKHFNWVKGKKVSMSLDAGRVRLWRQVLTGDGTDNIPGIMKLGPVTAERMILPRMDAATCRKVALSAWKKALAAGKVQLVKDLKPVGGGAFRYTDWRGRTVEKSAEQIMEEVYSLVKVGTPHALKQKEGDRPLETSDQGEGDSPPF